MLLSCMLKNDYCCSVIQSDTTLCSPINCFPVLLHLPEFAQTHIESVMASNDLILCCYLLFLSSIFLSIKGLFQ